MQSIFKSVNIVSDNEVIFNSIKDRIENLYGKLKTSNVEAIRNQSIEKPYVVKLGDNYYGWINKDASEELDEYDKACIRRIDKKLNSTVLQTYYI